MNLSSTKAVLWRGWRGDKTGEQVVQDGLHVEAAVEAELELGEVAVNLVKSKA